MHFTRLKLTGFKSFVEPTDLLIDTGLTGVVGPNGCGKSNLVEGLRWVMGETSPKQMRGGEMDDVIFAGTATRPARNVAEVVLVLDNSGRDAPAAYNAEPELDISRRIERGSGSNYRINGREVRARDVQTLFADATSGARSTALVSQGEIGELIGAKATERRHLLEEAAGITGLHSRRHEAELRLRAAEVNLDRLEDVIAALDSQLQALRRQARQAARYRSLSGRIRKAEASLFCRRWQEAQSELAATQESLAAAERIVGERARLAARAAAVQAEVAARLPDLRTAETEAAAGLHRLEVERDALETEARRLVEATAAAVSQRSEIDSDLARETALREEAEAAVRRFAEEAEGLRATAAGHEAEQAREAKALDAARAALAAVDRALAERTEQVAAAEAHRAGLARRCSELEARLADLVEKTQQVADETAVLEARLGDGTALAEAARALASARAEATARRGALDEAHRSLVAADHARAEVETVERAAREMLRGAEIERERAVAEADALTALLAQDAAAAGPPMVDRVTVAPGLELALAAALGDDLLASADPSAPSHWRVLTGPGEGPPLPAGAEPLDRHVSGPQALRRRLAQIGLIDRADGPRLQGVLTQGQRLVSRVGDLWRWDGFTSAADSQAGAAARLRRRQRLADLHGHLEGLESRREEAARAVAESGAALEAADQAYRQAREREAAARAAATAADTALEAAREAHTAASDALAADRSRQAALGEAAARLDADHTESADALAEARVALAALAPAAELRAPLEALRATLAEKRTAVDECFRACERLARAAEARGERLALLARESETWQRRAEDATRQLEALGERRFAVERRLEALGSEPQRLAALRDALEDRIDESAARRRAAADALAEAESALAEADKALKLANEELARTREEKVRAEGRRDQARSMVEVETSHIRERLDCTPQAALAMAEVAGADALDDRERLERQVERLHRERDNMGAVNLRAETEAAELGEQIDTMRAEREDLVSAIAKLRGGIASLNREGRQRLLAAFDEVNTHFRELFERLFGGGRAHLDLVGDDDPLEAGLEVMASPPGKRLQNLTLLSGGEKALAAIALLFAVFLTRPAPICVLDEVDASLDDVNVDRFCSLLEDIARHSQTRFLIITHHRLTMARMDRLFGVTMSERGVSQLVSVDMEEAVQLQAAE